MPSSRPAAIAVPEIRFSKSKSRIFNASGQTFDVQSAEGKTRIELYDEIGGAFGIKAKDIRERLQGAGDIVISINSPGGDVFEGLAIYNTLIAHEGHIRVEIIGVAASIASIIAMAGDDRAIASNSFFMIHDAWSLTVGNRHDHDEVAGLLKQIDGAMAKTYASRTGQNERDISRLMDEESWFEGQEAKAAGFATEILEPAERRARFDLSIYAKAPTKLLGEVTSAAIKPADISNRREYERFLRDAGFSRSRAKALAAGYNSAEDQREAETAESDLVAFIAAKTNEISISHKDRI